MPVTVYSEDEVPESAKITEINYVDGVPEYTYWVEGEPEVDIANLIEINTEQSIVKQKKKEKDKYDILCIKVKSTNGNDFDCDEQSQQRIARKIMVMDDNEKVDWKLSDGTVAKVKKDELAEVLKSAMDQQALIILSLQ